MRTKEIEKIEIDILLEAIFRRYGYDFRHYAKASLNRRLKSHLDSLKLKKPTDLLPRLLYDADYFNALLMELSINVTEMFRDPRFYQALRAKVVPHLKTYPFVKIWHAGCATGEEVYSMAILLKEEEFIDRAQIYATDFDNHALDKAQQGIYAIKDIQKYTKNYQRAQFTGEFSDYYRCRYQSALIDPTLKNKITFAHHNLVTDQVFGEMNLILCRNVLIYFDRDLQDRVLQLFSQSLCHRGFLCLGSKETLDFSTIRDDFEVVSKKDKIYRKK